MRDRTIAEGCVPDGLRLRTPGAVRPRLCFPDPHESPDLSMPRHSSDTDDHVHQWNNTLISQLLGDSCYASYLDVQNNMDT